MITDNTSVVQSLNSPSSELEIFSPNPGINQAIHNLLSQGLTPLPVAPAFPAEDYPYKKDGEIAYEANGRPKPLFSGKNPSFIDKHGVPRCINHTRYRNRMPSSDDLRQWFADERVGIGTNSGCWLDIDLKRFDSAEHMARATNDLQVQADWLEATQSGGLRIAIEFEDKPSFTNFGLGDVAHAGEILNGGGFVVLAPTVGANGRYERLKFGEPLKVRDAAALGLHKASSTKAPKPKPKPALKPQAGLPLRTLASKPNQAILQGHFSGDRSADLVALARELYGWETLASTEGIALGESADSILQEVAKLAGIEAKLERCLEAIDRETCLPALAGAQGLEAAQNRLRSLTGKKTKARSKPAKDLIKLGVGDQPGLIAFEHLYEDQNYVRIEDDIFKFTGTHYEKCNPRQEERRIYKLFKRCVEYKKEGDEFVETRPYCTGHHVRDAFNCCRSDIKFVDNSDINPAGINCTNGVLKITFDGAIPEFKLHPHHPDEVYTIRPLVKYDPNADATHCNRMLEAIGFEYRDLLLKVLAATFDLEAVNKRKSRSVRTTFLQGEGSNGKDVLRLALSFILGNAGLTNCSLQDFHDYDRGRKFNLARLRNSRLNWSSENSAQINVDRQQSLKAVITGDPIDYERKYGDAEPFVPNLVTVFSTNDATINITATTEAIQSRFAIIPFKKIFKRRPDPKKPNELKADPRFHGDSEWMQQEVCPAFLNILIDHYKRIFSEGIDYSPCEKTMEEHRLGANHLLQFAEDVGLELAEGYELRSSELYKRLQGWYEGQEILQVSSDGRERWAEDLRVGDKWIRSSSSLFRALKKLYPGLAAKHTKTGNKIVGLRFAEPRTEAKADEPSETPKEATEPSDDPTKQLDALAYAEAQEAHAQALDANVQEAKANPTHLPVPLTWDKPEWQTFELAMIAAETPEELQEAKAMLSEDERIACMNCWHRDGRKKWLDDHIAKLEESHIPF